ncbi:MAG: STAS domain-containing protein [Candidatus Omnitrophota bacterium]
MQINLEEKDGLSILRMNGDIDISTSPQLKKSFDKMLSGRDRKVVINLKDVHYVDSSGLATLVEIFKNLRVSGGKLKLTNLSAKVKGLFEITKLDKLFDILPEEKDAVDSF